MIYLCGMNIKSKVIGIESKAMMRLQFAAAEKGYRGCRKFIEDILEYVANDEGVLMELVNKMECQENDLERKENQNGTSGKSIPTDRKMNPDHRKMNLKNAENDFSGGELVISKSDKMFKDSYQKKTVLPNSVNGVSGQGASPLPVFTTEPYAGIPMVGEGEWKIRDGNLFITKDGKKGVIELLGADVESEYVHKRIIALHNGERTEIDLSAKSGRL